VALAVTAAAAGALTIVSPVAIPLVFGDDYGRAWTAVPLLGLAAVAAGAWKILGGDMAARGRPSVRLRTALLGLCAMVAVDLLAVPSLGMVGASAGAATGYAMAALAMAAAWVRLPGSSAAALWRFGRADFAVGRRAPAAAGGTA
jgi:O-antigen/teichoic acid export membrane protein